MNFDKLKKANLQSKFGRIARIAKRMLLLQRPMFRLTAPESKLAHSLLDGLRGIEIGPSTHNPFGLDTRNVGHHDPVYEQEQRSLTGSFAHIHIEAKRIVFHCQMIQKTLCYLLMSSNIAQTL